MPGDYITRLRQLLETVRKLQYSQSPAVERELLELEQELRDAATQMTLEACRQEVERRRGPTDRRQAIAQAGHDRRSLAARRGTDAGPGDRARNQPVDSADRASSRE